MNIVSLQEWNAYKQMLEYFILFIGFMTFFLVLLKKNLPKVNDIVIFLLAIIITYLIGNFPDMSNSGSDKANYFAIASNFSDGYFDKSINDIGFLSLTWVLAKLPLDWYFFILAAIYVGGIYLFSKSLSKKYAFIVFVCISTPTAPFPRQSCSFLYVWRYMPSVETMGSIFVSGSLSIISSNSASGSA